MNCASISDEFCRPINCVITDFYDYKFHCWFFFLSMGIKFTALETKSSHYVFSCTFKSAGESHLISSIYKAAAAAAHLTIQFLCGVSCCCWTPIHENG